MTSSPHTIYDLSDIRNTDSLSLFKSKLMITFALITTFLFSFTCFLFIYYTNIIIIVWLASLGHLVTDK